MSAKKTLRLAAFLALLPAILGTTQRQAAAETFTASEVHTLSLSSPQDKKSVSTGIGDAVEIVLPESADYIQGIEIDLKLPQKIAEQHEKLSWSLFADAAPLSQETAPESYSGTRIALGSFGPYLSLVLKLPLSPASEIKQDAYSYYIPSTTDFYGKKLVLLIQGARQLTEEDRKASPIQISAKPLFAEKSRLFITLKPPAGKESQPCTVFLDGKPCTPSKAGILVSPGIHDISVTSDFYRNELRAVTVESAKDTRVEIALRDIAPLIRIVAPEGTKIFLDEQPLANTQNYIPLSQGEHTLRLRLGSYEVVRQVTAQNGRNYSVRLTLEASVTEEE